jgi:hypothetical protein
MRATATTMTMAILLLATSVRVMRAQDGEGGHGQVGQETFSNETPGGGGQLESQGLDGKRTEHRMTATVVTPGVIHVLVTYYDCADCLGEAKKKAEDEKKKKAEKKDKKPDVPPVGPAVPTYDPRFFELKDGRLHRRPQALPEKSRSSSGSTGPSQSTGSSYQYDALGRRIVERSARAEASPVIERAGGAAQTQPVPEVDRRAMILRERARSTAPVGPTGTAASPSPGTRTWPFEYDALSNRVIRQAPTTQPVQGASSSCPAVPQLQGGAVVPLVPGPKS